MDWGRTAAAAALLTAGAAVQAKQVVFAGEPATSFANGTFTTTAVGPDIGGFYTSSGTPDVYAYNGFGANDLFIKFNAPVTFNSLVLIKCQFCFDASPISFTATIYDAAETVLGSQTVPASFNAELLTFDTPGVSSVGLTFAGGEDFYGVGYTSGWYSVGLVTYTGGVPEPATWALMITGFGLVGAALRSRRRLAPTRMPA